STAGSFPAFTCSERIGASLKVFGKALASRMISGPSSLPISDEPIFAGGAAVGAAAWAAAPPGCIATDARTPRPVSTNTARISFILPSCPVMVVWLREPHDAKYQRAPDQGQLRWDNCGYDGVHNPRRG